MNEVYLQLFKAGSAIIFILLIDFVIEFLLIRGIKDSKKSVKSRVLLRYILFFCLMFFLAKIWVEGFGYLLTFISVVSAALTITQKEYLMNFFGWLIIMWRDLFVEGDYIEMGKFCGYVKNIRPLYFSIEEASDLLWGDKTGRLIKIPNSLVATNPIVNYTADKAVLEGAVSFTFTFDSSLNKIENLVSALAKGMKEWLNSPTKREKIQEPRFVLRVTQSNPCGIQLKIRYTSLRQDQRKIEDKIFHMVMTAVNNESDLNLTVVT